MDNSCRLKLEWIPAAYAAIDKGVNDTPAGKPKQVHPVNGIYKSGNGFARVNKRKV
ncbi:hypothetical protein SAMN05192574_105438 [Mucilaginibacter gossypiicola]|uniref:Uncharacterized protein n=1 Tax=Mucilaginibacter gossypiicola TaxID=551995 RepID=A0A1H8M8I3_9SPHI|nr:hypothetical protein [Mucilaginibacter gossypiicola]SEO13570.1 hypothetical protein SAMN05192574_105438 [Mucilaginibacter gossypiicola]